ncbi:MAG TPA: hypothetical protein VK582_22585 [Pyrinomonadaceae bacterium]|nr:hypothetical protein [Pyrinomonadaceae bacterium]
MSGKRMNGLVLSMALIPAVFLISACTKTKEQPRTAELQPRVEPVVAPAPGLLPLVSPTPTPSPAKKSPAPPDLTEIRAAVARVFEKVATPDASRNATFAVGDFNGDGSEDLAVAVRASEGALEDINSELANWILEDPRTIPIPKAGTSARVPPGKQVRAERGDNLLAIIHGVGPQGWRAPEAKQTFVLKNGAGLKILSQSLDELRKATQKLPPLKGDVLNETINGKSGFVFWTGAKYAWWATPFN